MRLRTLLAGATALASLTGLAQAGDGAGWYAGVEAGVNWVDDIDQLEAYPGGLKVNQNFELDNGWGLLGTVGRKFAGGWRAEVEVGYRENEGGLFTGTLGTSFAPDATSSEFTLMANVVYDLMLGQGTSLSLGAGLGADRAHTTSKTAGFDDSDWSFAYQGIVGVNFDISPNMQMFANFRYLAIDGHDYYDASLPAFGTLHQDDITKETLTLGIRFALGDGGD